MVLHQFYVETMSMRKGTPGGWIATGVLAAVCIPIAIWKNMRRK